MEPFLALVALATATSLIVSPILALIALSRSKRLPLLERRVRELEQRVTRRVAPGAAPSGPAIERPLPRTAAPAAPPHPGAESTLDTAEPSTDAASALAQAEALGSAPPETPAEAAPAALEHEGGATPPPAGAGASELPFRRESRPERAAAQARPAAPAARRTPPQPRPPIEWERWIGVRGAAAVGAVLFALAGLLFFKHALEQGWLGPPARVAIGTGVGLLAIVAGEVLRRRDYRFAPAGTAGAGIVILFATTWASYARYGFLPSYVALTLMAVITAACAALSIRHRSQGVAVLGLVGGFATPILLSMHAQSPASLFGYLLLLDLGLLALGSRQRWSLLGILGALGTMVVQGVWVLGALRPEDTPFALFSLGTLALVLALGTGSARESHRGRWLVTQASALLLPFGFAIYFASKVHFGMELWTLATLAGVLTAGAGWTCRREEDDWLLRGMATASVALLMTWVAQQGLANVSELEFGLSALVLAAVHLAIGWLRRRFVAAETNAPSPFAIYGLGTLLLCVAIAGQLPASSSLAGVPLVWIALCGGLLVMLTVEGRVSGRLALGLRVVTAVVAGLALGTRALPGMVESLDDNLVFGAVGTGWRLALALGFAGFTAWRVRRDALRRPEAHAVGAFALTLLLTLPTTRSVVLGDPRVALSAIAALALVTALPAAALGRGLWQAIACAAFAFASVRFYDVQGWKPHGEAWRTLTLVGVGALGAWPFATRGRLASSRVTWLASGLLLPVIAFAFDFFQRSDRLENSGLLAMMSAALLGLATTTLKAGTPAARTARPTFAVAALGFLGLTAARHFGHEVGLVSVAFLGLGSVAVGLHYRSVVAETLGGALTLLASLALLMGVARPNIYPAAGPLVWNWTSYMSGTIALCAIGATALVRRAARLEAMPKNPVRPLLSVSLGLASLVGVFVWLNLQVLLHFETDSFIDLDLQPLQRRDLAMSVTWIGYALLLLALGMARHFAGLRQASLVVLLITLTKVFLRDLGELTGLYQVGSVAGLALSLLLVSLLYQRFVFPRKRAATPLESSEVTEAESPPPQE